MAASVNPGRNIVLPLTTPTMVPYEVGTDHTEELICIREFLPNHQTNASRSSMKV